MPSAELTDASDFPVRHRRGVASAVMLGAFPTAARTGHAVVVPHVVELHFNPVFLLALVWGFFPEVLLAIWSIGYSEGTGVVARRSAVLFAALG